MKIAFGLENAVSWKYTSMTLSWISQTYRISELHLTFWNCYVVFPSERNILGLNKGASWWLDYLFFVCQNSITVETQSWNHPACYIWYLLPFKASTFSCFPFLYSFLRFFILEKKKMKMFWRNGGGGQMVETSTHWRVSFPFLPHLPLPSHRINQEAKRKGTEWIAEKRGWKQPGRWWPCLSQRQQAEKESQAWTMEKRSWRKWKYEYCLFMDGCC